MKLPMQWQAFIAGACFMCTILPTTDTWMRIVGGLAVGMMMFGQKSSPKVEPESK